MSGFKVGDSVCCKSGVEEYGQITKITGGAATVAVWCSDRGENVSRSVSLSRLSHDS